MTLVDTATGEIIESTALATVDASSEIAVTSYLQQARDWLATAVESTGPEQIARAKAEIATAAEATKQLNLSKEIQDDAREMVRRAEYALGKSIRKGQSDGSVATRGYNQHASSNGGEPAITKVPDLIGKNEWRGDLGIATIAEATEHEFESAIAEAREEGNLSRANVARKLKPQRATRRAPLTDFAFEASTDLLKVAERLVRVLADDRFKDNRTAISQQAGGQINRSIELIQQFSNAINSETTP